MSELSKRLAALSPQKRALLLHQLQQERQNTPAPIEPNATVIDRAPLAPGQELLWFLEQLYPDHAANNVPLQLRLVGNLDACVLERSLNDIIARHEILRTNFEILDEKPVQVIHPPQAFVLPMIDLRHLRADEQKDAIALLTSDQVQQSFDLARDRLLRIVLLRLQSEEHLIFLTIHHIVTDGWSVGILLTELTTLYNVFLQGHPSPLAALPMQYKDFAQWQQAQMRGGQLAAQLDYWKQHLADHPFSTQLPTDRPRPPIQTYRGERLSFELDAQLSAALRALSRQENTSWFITLLAAFKSLIHRYTGQEDMIIGTAIAGRNRVELEPLIGLFINQLALRTNLSGNPSFREVLRRVREVALKAYTHQDLPFATLIEAIQPERNLGQTPIYQLEFIFQNSPTSRLDSAYLSWEVLAVDTGYSKYDLTLFFMSESANGLEGVIVYNADLFDASTISRMAGHYQVLLAGAIAEPDQPIASLPILSAAERHHLLTDWNANQAAPDQTTCFHALFEARLAQWPDAVALEYTGEALTYLALNRRANQLAHYLRRQGIGPEKRVGICMERCTDMIVAVLATFKAGGAYVPLDPGYPVERLSYMLADAGASVLITQRKLADRLPNFGEQILYIDAQWPQIASESAENLPNSSTPSNLAYVIYTSGSTGKPKGVMVPHASMMSFYRALRHGIYAHYAVPPKRITFNAPLVFDASVQQLVTLLDGCHLSIVPESTRLDGSALTRFLQEHAIEVFDCTPSQLSIAVDAGLLEDAQTTLRCIICGGEAVSGALWQQLAARPAIDVYNVYGPTECTVDTLMYRIQPELARPVIGRPMLNTRVYVLDRFLQPVPVGIPGELFIGGDNLCRGYLNRPDLTAERFIPDPFSAEPGAWLYKTGDIVRYLPDGHIEFVGRSDDQVKIRGYRIELGEVEAALRQHYSVHSAVVVVQGDGQLVAYVVPRQPLNIPELRGSLQQKLPPFMVPSTFVLLDSLPVNKNGKVDRQTLPLPGQIVEPDEERIAPRTPTEQKLAVLWEEVLERQAIDIRDDFFHLGGHSLLAARLVNRIRKVFDIEFPISALFEHPTVEGLAREVDRAILAQSGHPDQPGAVDTLSDEEVDALLRQMLDQTGKA